NYTSVIVGSTGLIRLGSVPDVLLYDGLNSTAKFTGSSGPLIAALWDNLGTAGVGNDVFVETNTAAPIKFVKIRFNATNLDNSTNVQFAVVLFADGTIRFDYGAGNTGLTPTVGISSGTGLAFQTVPGYDGATS